VAQNGLYFVACQSEGADTSGRPRVDELLRAADANMYAHKAASRVA
jgi:hypothetical protein